MEITKSMYLLAKKIVNEYEGKVKTRQKTNTKTLQERKDSFMTKLKPYIQSYSKEMLRAFYDYWTEHGENDRKFRAEKEKSFSIERRLKTWNNNNKKFNKNDKKVSNDFKQEILNKLQS